MRLVLNHTLLLWVMLTLGCWQAAAPADTGQVPSTPAPAPQRPKFPPVPPADGFDWPVGPPDAKGYYDAQPFQRNKHLGEDWNGRGGGNTDLGDPVHAIGIGVVAVAEDYLGGWGNVVQIYHNIGSATEPRLIVSLYAHMDTVLVHVGDTVARGQQIGTIGNAHGAYWAHLHLEIRHDPALDLGGGYSEDTTGFWAPSPFIKAHRRL